MSKRQDTRLMLAEQVLEVRHVPTGSFLDVRGFIADYIVKNSFLPHWSIDTNVVKFRDAPKNAKKEGAFVGYRNSGYLCFDPETRNFFQDRASLLWKLLQKNNHFKLPDIQRFGARTKAFLPSNLSFEDIHSRLLNSIFSAKSAEIAGGALKDIQFVFDLTDGGFEVRMLGGPMHKGEAASHFGFESEMFEQTGLFVDIDFFKKSDVNHQDVPKLLKNAVSLTWPKIERLASEIGI